MRKRYIYKIVCVINNKFYIGQTCDIEVRFKQHMKGVGGCKVLYNDVKKFGANKFDIEIIHTLDNGHMKTDNHYMINIIERAYNFYYSCKQPELIYNKKGKCNWAPFTDEHNNKLKENHADFKGENHPMYGKHHSNETKEKMRIANTGVKMPPFTDEHRLNLSIARKGMKFTDEWKKNMSIAQKKRWADRKAKAD